MIQLLLRRQANTLLTNEWQDFLGLQSHIDDFRTSRTKNAEGLTTWQTIELMSQAALTYSGSKEPFELIQTLTARVRTFLCLKCIPTKQPPGPHQHSNPHNPNLRSPRSLHLTHIIPHQPQLRPQRRHRLLQLLPNPPLPSPHPRNHRTLNLLHRHHNPNPNSPIRAPKPLLLHLHLSLLPRT